MDNVDPDIRFMACADLTDVLGSDKFSWDINGERVAGEKVIKLLRDVNGEVQNQAVKCLVALVPKLTTPTLIHYMGYVCDMLSADPESGQTRDIPCMALKAMITSMPVTGNVGVSAKAQSSLEPQVFNALVPKLTMLLNSDVAAELLLDVLDIVSELFCKISSFLSGNDSPVIQDQIKHVQTALLKLLKHSRSVIRRKAVAAFGPVAANTGNASLLKLVDVLLVEIELSDVFQASEEVKSFVFCLGTVLHSAPLRLGTLVPRAMDAFEKAFKADCCELRQTTLLALDTMLLRYPLECLPFSERIESLLYESLKGGDGTEDDYMAASDSGSDGFYDSDDDYFGSDDSDGDDQLWKVKYAALKTVSHIIANRPDLNAPIVLKLVPLLVDRFSRERDDSLKIEFAQVLTLLVNSCRGFDESVLDELLNKSAQTLESCSSKVKGHNSTQLPANCFLILGAAVKHYPKAVQKHLHVWIPKLEAVFVPSETLTGRPESAFSSLGLNKTSLFAAVFDTIGEIARNDIFQQDKVSAYWKELVIAIVHFASSDALNGSSSTGFSSSNCMARTFLCLRDLLPLSLPADVMRDLKAALTRTICEKADVEVSNAAINVVPQFLRALSSSSDFGSALTDLFLALLGKLDSPVNRQSALDSLALLATFEGIGQNAEISFSQLADALCLLLRQANWRVRQGALLNLEKWLAALPASRVSDNLVSLFESVLPGIADQTDLSILPSSLTVMRQLVGLDLGSSQMKLLCGELFKLLESQPHWLTASSCLIAYGRLWDGIAGSNAGSFVDYEFVHSHLGYGKASTAPLARIFSAVALHSAGPKSQECLKLLLKHAGSGEEVARLVSIAALGEIGKHRRVSEQDFSVVWQSLGQQDASNAVKAAAAVSIGQMATKNPECLNLEVLQRVSGQHGYCWLSAVEFLKSPTRSKSLESSIWSLATAFVAQLDLSQISAETFGLVSECVGRLVLRQPDLASELTKLLKAPHPANRALGIGCVQVFVNFSKTAPSLLDISPFAVEVIRLVSDPELPVKRAALYTLNVIVHENKELICRDVNDLMSALYEAAVVNESLIQNVTIGPFKHKVDDGLEVRKAAFECLYTLLEYCPHQYDFFRFIQQVLLGLNDPSIEIQILANQILQKLVQVAAAVVGNKLDAVLEAFQAAFDKIPEKNPGKPENDKIDDVLAAQARSIVAINHKVILNGDPLPLLAFSSQKESFSIPSGSIHKFQNLLRTWSDKPQFSKSFEEAEQLYSKV